MTKNIETHRLVLDTSEVHVQGYPASRDLASAPIARAYRPGEGHRFLGGVPVCVFCGRAQATPAIRTLCLTGVLYDFTERQGSFRFELSKRLDDMGLT